MTPERIPPRLRWPTSKEGLKRGSAPEKKEVSVWDPPKKTKLQENCYDSKKGSRKLVGSSKFPTEESLQNEF